MRFFTRSSFLPFLFFFGVTAPTFGWPRLSPLDSNLELKFGHSVGLIGTGSVVNMTAFGGKLFVRQAKGKVQNLYFDISDLKAPKLSLASDKWVPDPYLTRGSLVFSSVGAAYRFDATTGQAVLLSKLNADVTNHLTSFDVDEKYAYAVDSRGALSIWEYKSNETWTPVGTVVNDEKHAVILDTETIVQNKTMYVCASTADPKNGYLDVWNVADPRNPHLLGGYEFQSNCEHFDLKNGILVAQLANADGIEIRAFNVGDPAFIREIAAFPDHYRANDSSKPTFFVSPGKVVLKEGAQLGLFEVDFAGVRKITEITRNYDDWIFEPDTKTLFAREHERGIFAIDLSDFAHPKIISEVAPRLDKISSIARAGEHTLYALTERGLFYVDFFDPAAPKISPVPMDTLHWQKPGAIATNRGYLYVATEIGVTVFDAVDARFPRWQSFNNVGPVLDLVADDDFLYAITGTDVHVLDVSRPKRPGILFRTPVRRPEGFSLNRRGFVNANQLHVWGGTQSFELEDGGASLRPSPSAFFDTRALRTKTDVTGRIWREALHGLGLLKSEADNGDAVGVLDGFIDERKLILLREDGISFRQIPVSHR